jgi:hypothetical protein
VRTGRQRQRIKAKRIGAGAGLLRFAPKRGTEQHFPAGSVLHVPAQLVGLSTCTHGHKDQSRKQEIMVESLNHGAKVKLNTSNLRA